MRTSPAPGSDPTPGEQTGVEAPDDTEPSPDALADARLLRDVPPHYGDGR